MIRRYCSKYPRNMPEFLSKLFFFFFNFPDVASKWPPSHRTGMIECSSGLPFHIQTLRAPRLAGRNSLLNDS